MALVDVYTTHFGKMEDIVSRGFEDGYKYADEYAEEISKMGAQKALAKLVKTAYGDNIAKFEVFASKVALLDPEITFSEEDARKLLMLIWRSSKETYDNQIRSLVYEVMQRR